MIYKKNLEIKISKQENPQVFRGFNFYVLSNYQDFPIISDIPWGNFPFNISDLLDRQSLVQNKINLLMNGENTQKKILQTQNKNFQKLRIDQQITTKDLLNEKNIDKSVKLNPFLKKSFFEK